MSVKKFVAPDMKQALKMVRDQLGPDAMILANRKVAGGVEISAAVDYAGLVDRHAEKQREQARRDARLPEFADDDAPLSAPLAEGGRVIRPTERREPDAARARRPAPRQEGMYGEVLAARTAARPAATERPAAQARPSAEMPNRELLAMRNEINQLRAMLDNRFAQVGWSEFRHHQPVQAAAYKQLHRMGLSAPLCRRYVQALNAPSVQEGMRWIFQRMTREVSVFPEDIREIGGVFAFVGPAGVGKTTTISKIAASWVLRHGTADVALVTTDSYRIAGHEQLRTLGKILNVPVRVATEQHPLEELLAELSDKRLVLIDTAGLGRRDQDFGEQMGILDRLPESVRRVLVLASTSQKRILEKAVADYQNLGIDACVLTKLDECASLGESISVIIESGLSLAYTTDGQNIPDDIARPDVHAMVHQALTLSKESDIEESETAEWFDEHILSTRQYEGAA